MLMNVLIVCMFMHRCIVCVFLILVLLMTMMMITLMMIMLMVQDGDDDFYSLSALCAFALFLRPAYGGQLIDGHHAH